ncbi:hypothetical protein NEAUS04_1134 [Nematocida ausubeli]|uniref:Uncharacterized protein n=1 Tax=Nematocida ausubeli (strain ATCC PRA-371 / ERTm2) TaxID=1913371 RepID=H8ZBZ1_NEMA1|nr:uncharacterized protein NESG_02073 [Nematocida ausubeli]EHY65627.1 hypothetical protein NERG_01234 [Nematocida ausubeli]KAI5134001.1 hypothetical protein NEAUS06_0868 [Nematocida ausubeli]KAI5134264.1 hypothetical protein NEAUS06_1013 [Nematocida ausubeli]KAI5136091.1 hypothetical protein NEAUS07_1468 [Nematocida ausubeli]KAI5148979.1 hypothetical protein NEAUS05_1599 [Nematocida ausubeli]
MDVVERLASLHQDLTELNEKTEKTKITIKKTLKEIRLPDKNLPAKASTIIDKVKAEVSSSKILELSLGISEIKLPEKLRYKYKSDYETFKLTSTIAVTILTLLNLLFFSSKIMDTVQILIQMYIYSTLTIREHILINNGSHIKRWWILHHYICIVITGMMLTCPDESFSFIRTPVLKFLFVLSCSQLVQYQYQMRRLYILRALKKADPLEITSDVMNVSLMANLWVAVGILVLFQFIQMYVSYYIYTLHVLHAWRHYQPFIGALLIGAMSFGNMFTIFYTCYNKGISPK